MCMLIFYIIRNIQRMGARSRGLGQAEFAVPAAPTGNGIGFEIKPAMRWIGLIIIILGLGGCAAQPVNVSPLQQARAYAPANGPALAFDPPILAGVDRLDLSRDGRQAAAFAGFDDETTTYYFLSSDNSYSDFSGGFGRGGYNNPDNYQRTAVSETYGVSYR
jgi:hypothetical protein